MLILVLFDIEVITFVPLPPHPIIPMRIAEFAFDPNAAEGLNIVIAESAAVLCKNSLLFIVCLLSVMKVYSA